MPPAPPARRRFDAVLFDLDGVLVDSEPWWNDVRIAFAREHGRPWTRDDHHAVMGANSRGWALTMQERLGLHDMDVDAIQDAIVDGVVARYRSEPPPVIDGAVEAVRRIAAERPVAIASSAHPDVITAAVDAIGVRKLLGAIVSSDEVPHGKPAPDVYIVAAERLGVDPAHCLVVEDSINGVKAGKAAGMFVVLVPNASVPPPPGTDALADAVVARLGDLDPDRVAA